jgi:hypothetical protein
VVSFSDEHARLLGLDLGDTVTVNILGREITGTVANTRVVDFSDMGINFLMAFDPGAFAGAPHTHIATVYATPRAPRGRCCARSPPPSPTSRRFACATPSTASRTGSARSRRRRAGAPRSRW